VREKGAGTLEQLLVTPVSPGELVLAKLIPMGIVKMVGLVIGLAISIFVLFPTMFLSGTLVPIENMHPALQYLSYLSPLRYYLDITLGVFLKGVGLEVLWPQAIALAKILNK
jgi:ABC-2 type transport system permease protein